MKSFKINKELDLDVKSQSEMLIDIMCLDGQDIEMLDSLSIEELAKLHETLFPV